MCSITDLREGVGDASRVLGVLGLSLCFVEFSLLQDLASPLRSLAVTEWVKSIAAYLAWKAHDTCRLWCCPSRALHSLKVLFLQSALGASGFPDLQCYVAGIERSVWTSVLSGQLMGWSRAACDHDRSPVRCWTAGDFFVPTPLREILRKRLKQNAVALNRLVFGPGASERHS